jgi:hypothetical protein
MKLKNSNDLLIEKLDTAHSLSWDELTSEIIHLEDDLNKNRKVLKQSEIQLYQDVIYMYEVEKSLRIPLKRRCGDYLDYTMGPRSAFAAWIHISDKEMNKIVYGINDPKEEEEDDNFM